VDEDGHSRDAAAAAKPGHGLGRMCHVHPLTPAREAEAVAALRRGEDDGLRALVELHELPALRLAHSITGSRAAAEDVVADAFVAVGRHRDRLDPDRPLKTCPS
jgi:hypothetical protein